MLQKKQAVYHIRKNKVYPFRFTKSKQNLDILGQMLESISCSIGKTRSEIEENLQYFARQIWQPKLSQAIVKLLLDKAVFDEEITQQQEVREHIFQNSQKFWTNLKAVPNIAEIVPHILKASFKKPPAWSENLLYKDLPANQTLKKMQSIPLEDFINWVDLSMARVLLLNAESINIVFYKEQQNLRTFMRYLKFFGLLFTVQENKNDSEIIIEGPDTILENSRGYGINFCNLLPAALLVEGEWKITAKIQLFGRKNFQFQITSEDHYKSFYKKENFLRQQKITELIANWKEKNTKVKMSNKIFSLKKNFWLLPDIEISFAKNKKCYFEWVQYPFTNTKGLQEKIQMSPNNYFFLMISSKKRFLQYFKNSITEKKIICFSKNFIQSKLEEYMYEN